MSFLRKRLQDEKGFTLIELLIVIIILAILMAIAIPSYLKFKDRANNAAAQANIRAAVPAVEAYGQDYASGYTGMTLAKLQASYDAGVKGMTVVSAAQTTYCLKSTKGSPTYYKKGAGGDISTTTCS